MANLVVDKNYYDRNIFKIEGPLSKSFVSTEEVSRGQVLAYDRDTGQVVKYVKGDSTKGIAFSVAMEDAKAGSKVLVATPGTVLNKNLLTGVILIKDFGVIEDLFKSGILLEEVKGYGT
ncbi:hypothetical protein [Cetobacterium sp. ZWU0022]|uniref:hypothetical protein n=1 Tax=Cetobacterium sp. ZWU0022 TaxID=1340502 RepID=UPI0006488964|nr:hypothetical protein [Cetobacterium sp. ZWU0022]